ncbi:MAG: macro domain-containing protein [bacterium]
MEVQFLVGDVTKLEVDAVVNPANSEGEMGGGLAGALKKAGGKKIEEAAMELAPIPIGKAVVTTAGKLKCDYIIHAPTMVAPVQRTTVEKISQAVQAALRVAADLNVERLAIPGMGTGTGRVAPEDAARAITDTIQQFATTSKEIKEIILVDKNTELIEAMERFWAGETPA